jgi:hypothetical protein
LPTRARIRAATSGWNADTVSRAAVAATPGFDGTAGASSAAAESDPARCPGGFQMRSVQVQGYSCSERVDPGRRLTSSVTSLPVSLHWPVIRELQRQVVPSPLDTDQDSRERVLTEGGGPRVGIEPRGREGRPPGASQVPHPHAGSPRAWSRSGWRGAARRFDWHQSPRQPGIDEDLGTAVMPEVDSGACTCICQL